MLVLLDPGVLFSGNWTHMLNTVSQVISLLILYEICSFNHFRQVMQVENEVQLQQLISSGWFVKVPSVLFMLIKHNQ